MIQQRHIAFPPDGPPVGGGSDSPFPPADLDPPSPTDGVSRLLPSWLGGSSAAPSAADASGSGLLSGILTELSSMLGQIIGLFGGSPPSSNSGTPQTFYQNASASSQGDPHLAFSGTSAAGGTQQARFDSMTAQPDLLDSDSFTGGYTIATTATAPDARGVTYNQSASVTTNFGATTIALDNAGNASIVQNGQTTALQDGASIDLGQGEVVTRGNDGAVQIADYAPNGGSISTTLRDNGSGVDVAVQAGGVDLGGALPTAATSPAPSPSPSPPRWSQPLPVRPTPARQ